MGGCQNYGEREGRGAVRVLGFRVRGCPFWGTLNIRCRIIRGIQKKDHTFDNHPYCFKMFTVSLRVQVPNNHILTQNL